MLIYEKDFYLLDMYWRITNKQLELVGMNAIGLDDRWAYKWLKRFDKSGLDGLKDQPRTGILGQVYDIMKSTSIDYYTNGASVLNFQGRNS